MLPKSGWETFDIWLVAQQRPRAQWTWLCMHFASAGHMLHSFAFLLICQKLYNNIFEIGRHVQLLNVHYLLCEIAVMLEKQRERLKCNCILCFDWSALWNLVSGSNFALFVKMFNQKEFSSLVSHTSRWVLTALRLPPAQNSPTQGLHAHKLQGGVYCELTIKIISV